MIHDIYQDVTASCEFKDSICFVSSEIRPSNLTGSIRLCENCVDV